MKFGSKITGLEGVAKTLQNMPRVTARRIIMPSLRAGAGVIKAQAEANVRIAATAGYATGGLEKNIRFYNYRKYRGRYRVGVQVRRKAVSAYKIVKGQAVRMGLYAAVLDYGKKGQPPTGWLRGAIRGKMQDAVAKVVSTLKSGLPAVVNEAKK